jgi:predicted oxidoreductase
MPGHGRLHTRALVVAAIAAKLAGCAGPRAPAPDADVIVVGAGIAGLAAALEAEAHGARVIVVEANSLPGGHAIKAGGFALVDTPLQRSKGYRDSPDVAFRDMMAWGEDADPWWVRHYVDNARAEVHDWLAAMGVKFVVVLDTPEDTVPRFHFTRGAAVNAVVPMIREALRRERIEFVWNAEVAEILRRDGEIAGVRARLTRTGGERVYRAPAVIVTTGGYQNDIARVRRTWTESLPAPARLLAGAGRYALGSGLDLVEPFGAGLVRLDRQVTFVTGLPDPRDPAGERGLLAQNPAAIWVDATGRRFTNEAAPSKVTERAVLQLTPATHWLVFDAEGKKRLIVRGAAWLDPKSVQREIVDNPALVKRADSVEALAAAAGLPPGALAETVTRFNRFLELGTDTDFGRVAPGTTEPALLPIRKPPFYAVQLFPMTRKSMGGIAVDHETRVVGGAVQVIRGLFAAGEVTGVAGINGSFGGSGTFLGPAVLMGRMAGRGAVALALGPAALEAAAVAPRQAAAPEEGPAAAAPAAARPVDLAALLRQERKGYWHFGASHALVAGRGDDCATCHRAPWPPGPAETRAQRLVQVETCTRCH